MSVEYEKRVGLLQEEVKSLNSRVTRMGAQIADLISRIQKLEMVSESLGFETYTQAEIAEKLESYYAYQMGSHDSGVSDPVNEKKLKETLVSLREVNRSDFDEVIDYVVKTCFGEPPYGEEDIIEFRRWLEDDFLR